MSISSTITEEYCWFCVSYHHVSRVWVSNRVGTGSVSMTVHGTRIVVVMYTGRSRDDHTRCESTEWSSETSVRCLLGHGAGSTRRSVL